MEIAPSFDEMQSILHHANLGQIFPMKNNKLQVFLYNKVNLAHFQQELVLPCCFKACYEMLYIIVLCNACFRRVMLLLQV